MTLRLVPLPRVSSPATTALKVFVWLIRDARLHPDIADVRYRDAHHVLAERIRLEAQ
jgi:hypothetical protein